MRVSAPTEDARDSLRRKIRWIFKFAFTTIVVFTAAFFVLWPQVRAHLQAAAILWQLNERPVPRWIQPFASEPVTAQAFTLQNSQSPMSAILYVPVHHPNAPGMVILHGVHHLGIQEPRLVSFARSMAACGLRVLTPELPGIKDYQVTPSAIARIGDASNWMAQTTGHPVGVMGISFSGGLALMAAAEPQYANQISFVFTIGAQDSMARVASFYATGDDALPDGSVEHIQPHEYGPLVLEYEHLEDFTQPAETEALRAVLRARLNEEPAAEQTRLAHLTAVQQVAYQRLIHPQKIDVFLANSSRKHVSEFDAVSPHGHLQNLHAPVLLLHGQGDNIIPSAESEWLQHDLPQGRLHALLISPLISHVGTQQDARPTVLDEWRLLHLIAQVMEAAEQAPAAQK